MKLVGTVGRIGSGKDTVVEYLHRRCGLPVYSLGDMVREAAEKEGIRITRKNLQEFVRRRMDTDGEDVFIHRLVCELEEKAPESAGITGIRRPREVKILKSLFGNDFLLVLVEVRDPKIRFRRVLARGEPRDPKNFQDFETQNRREESIFNIGETVRLADIVIPNDGSLEELNQRVEDKIIAGFLKNNH